MTRLPPERREVYPSRRAGGRRRAPSFGPRTGVSVPISIGLPLIVVGLALIAAAVNAGGTLFWIAGGLLFGLGLALFASGRRL
jgi:hypothetical protein